MRPYYVLMPMAFAARHQRYPIFRPMRYEVLLPEGFRTGHGTVTNLSTGGWRIYGNVPVSVGDVCSLKVRLSVSQWVFVTAGIVRWARGEEYGIETVSMNADSQARLNEYIQERVKAM